MPIRATPSVGPTTLRDRDEILLAEWDKATGFNKDQKLDELLRALSGAIGSAVNTYRASPLPFSTLELEGKRLAVHAIRSWDKSKGTSLASYVGTHIRQRLYRFVAEHQNVARMPEAQVRQVGNFNRAVEDLRGRYGSEPSTTQIADYMHLPVSHVTRLRKSLRQDLLESAGEAMALEDHTRDPSFEKVSLAYYSLSEQEKSVFDYLLGAHGQPRLSPRDIASRLGVTAPRVSKIKATIARKLEPYLG